MAGLYEIEYSCSPPKLGMIIISVIELIFFLIDEFNEENSTNFTKGPMGNTFIYDPTKRYQVWRYLTYMFVHIGYLHLVVNMVLQIFLGIALEMVHGWWRVLLIYFTGVVAGSLGTSITNPTTILAGASGGVYSLITAYIVTIIMNWSKMRFPAIQLLVLILLLGIADNSNMENSAYAAHFAGAVAGLLVGIFVQKNLKPTKKKNVMWWIAVAIYVVLMLVGICWNIFYTEYFPKQI